MAFQDTNPKRFHKKNPYIDRRESKNREIKRALVHKARLTKNYFKELKKEGEAIPEKKTRTERDAANTQKKPLTFQERARIAKERKKADKKKRAEALLEKKRISKEKEEERLRKKERVSQKTRTGQPLMGPRIENLLEKIKKDYV